MALHSLGIATFEREYGVDLLKLAADCTRRWHETA